MGGAAYNRGSKAIASIIQHDYAHGLAASGARTMETNLRDKIDRQASEITKLRRKLLLLREAKTNGYQSWVKLDADFHGFRRHATKMIRELMDANAEKERQRAKLARCVREHLSPEEWLAWSDAFGRR